MGQPSLAKEWEENGPFEQIERIAGRLDQIR